MSNALLNKINRRLNKLEKEVELATSFIPEGYQVAKDSLSQRVKLMAEGLYSFSTTLEEQRKEIQILEKRESILVDAMAEIKATSDGKSDQPIKDIIDGCIKELGEI